MEKEKEKKADNQNMEVLRKLTNGRVDVVGGVHFFRDPYTNNDSPTSVGFPLWFVKAPQAGEEESLERLGTFNNWNTAARWLLDNEHPLGPYLYKALSDYIASQICLLTPAPPRSELVKFGGTLTNEAYAATFKPCHTNVVSAADLVSERAAKLEKRKKEKEEKQEDPNAAVVSPIAFFKQVLEQLPPSHLSAVTIAALPDAGFFCAQSQPLSAPFVDETAETFGWNTMPTLPEDPNITAVAGPYLKRKKAKKLAKIHKTAAKPDTSSMKKIKDKIKRVKKSNDVHTRGEATAQA